VAPTAPRPDGSLDTPIALKFDSAPTQSSASRVLKSALEGACEGAWVAEAAPAGGGSLSFRFGLGGLGRTVGADQVVRVSRAVMRIRL